MKRYLLASIGLVVLLFNSCVTERAEENSFYLNQIARIQLETTKTVFFSESIKENLNLNVRFFDKDNRPFLTNVRVPYQIYLGDSLINGPELDLSKKGVYKLRVTFPTRREIFSNEIEIRIVGGEYIKSLVLDFSNETRNNFAVARNTPYDFILTVIGPDGPVPNIQDQVLRNLSLQMGTKTFNRLTGIPLEDVGLINVRATLFGVNSNVLGINSREDVSIPIREFQLVFHVFSNGPSVPVNQLEIQVANTNLAFGAGVRTSFRKNMNAVNANFRFKLAELDPDGRALVQKGYNLIQNDRIFQNASDPELSRLKFNNLWDPSRYINVFVEDLSSIGAGGYAFLPYLTNPAVDGLFPILSADTELFYPIQIALDYRIFTGQWIESYILAHELGHYFGLYHTFQDCVTGDFVDDTPSHTISSNTISTNSLRLGCGSQSFISTNFMDYIFPIDHFTFDQRDRMNKVFENALFMPRDLNGPDSRLKPFKRGILDPTIQPVICNFD